MRAPQRMKETAIRKFVEQQGDWIKRKQARAQEDALPERQFVPGEYFMYLGEEFPLRLVQRQKPALVMDKVFKLSESAQPQAKSVFEAWYKNQAGTLIPERVNLYARRDKFKFNKLRISSARKRWGSCSAKRTLSFTWRLVMAPLDVIDYVVVHELCHLIRLDHSEKYWDLVAGILPDYKLKRKWLKDNGRFLIL